MYSVKPEVGNNPSGQRDVCTGGTYRLIITFITVVLVLLQSICNELKSGDVQSLSIMIGSSVFCAREVYFIRLPESFSKPTPAQIPKREYTKRQLFR